MSEDLLYTSHEEDLFGGYLNIFKCFGNLGQPKWDCSLAQGVAINMDQEILVADPSYNRIQIFDMEGKLLRAIKSVPRAYEMRNPSKVAVNRNNGQIYVIEPTSNFGIKVFDYKENFLKTCGKHEYHNKVISLAIDNRDNILVLEKEESGSVILSIVKENGYSQRHKLNMNFSNPTGIAAWDGKVYVSDGKEDFIQVFDYSGNHCGNYGTILRYGMALCMSKHGNLVVSVRSSDSFKLKKFTTNGILFADYTGKYYHGEIRDMAVQEEYVVFATSDGIRVYKPLKNREYIECRNWAPDYYVERMELTLTRSIPLCDDTDQWNLKPYGVAASAVSDTLYVSNELKECIQLFSKEGTYLGHIPNVSEPCKLVVDRTTNNVLVLATRNQPRIRIYSCKGEWKSDVGKGSLVAPENLDVDKYGRIFVIQKRHRYVKVFDVNGSLIKNVRCVGLLFPSDICISENQQIFIADRGTSNIQVYSYDGELLRCIGNSSITKSPKFVKIANNGLIVVVDIAIKKLRLTYFKEDGTFVSAHQSTNLHSSCYDVSVMTDGSVVVACEGDTYQSQIFIYLPSDITGDVRFAEQVQ